MCWGGPNPKRFEPPGLYQQVSVRRGPHVRVAEGRPGQVLVFWSSVFFFGLPTPSTRLLDTIRHRRDPERRAGARTTTRAARSRRPENSCRSRRATPSPCGLRPSGLVECWGNDRKGQSTPPDDVQFLQIATSNVVDHACGLTLGARDLKCWGDNRKGQSPEHVDGPWEQVACGSKATCAIADGGSHAGASAPPRTCYDTREKTAFRGRTLEPRATALCVLDVEGEVVCHGHPGRTLRGTCRTGLLRRRACFLILPLSYTTETRKTTTVRAPSPRHKHRDPVPGTLDSVPRTPSRAAQ